MLFTIKYFTILSIFRAINAFLNTGKGGTVYLGIVDEGVVKGIRLSQYQVYFDSIHAST